MYNISPPAINVSHLVARVAHGWAGHPRVRPAKAPEIAPAALYLGEHESLYLTGFQGGTIACLEGCLWLTHDGDCRDIVLEAGQSHVADRDSRLAIHALARSTVRFAPCRMRIRH